MLFSEDDINFIKLHYTSHGAKYCANKLNKKSSQISKKANRLGLSANRKLMVQNNPELLKHLRNHAHKILKPINENNKISLNIEELENLYTSGRTLEEIAKIYNCSDCTISKFLKNIAKRKCTDYKSHKCYNQIGSLNPAWKGGIKDIYNRFRDLSEYYNWRKEVLNRDGNKCTSCNNTEKLHSHHIKTLKTLIWEYSIKVNKLLKELTREDLTNSYFYDLSNGSTLCEDCHKKWHKENGR